MTESFPLMPEMQQKLQMFLCNNFAWNFELIIIHLSRPSTSYELMKFVGSNCS